MENYLSPLIAGGIIALFAFTLKHSINGDRHPKKSDVVYKDVCDAQQRHIAETTTGILDRIRELKEDNTKRFDRLENLINEQRKPRY